ncbi:hypothetical protein NDU88_003702 [Pleurodeles waltl]|uniref:Uncharacterized protein n=1 Tax=Pleurodeles waltl TaxID=8319 RepID=A0AAV7NH59_PLEWA|nr:hypothetical protein NDU88_003702 [Pleurodeles waltl]
MYLRGTETHKKDLVRCIRRHCTACHQPETCAPQTTGSSVRLGLQPRFSAPILPILGICAAAVSPSHYGRLLYCPTQSSTTPKPAAITQEEESTTEITIRQSDPQGPATNLKEPGEEVNQYPTPPGSGCSVAVKLAAAAPEKENATASVAAGHISPLAFRHRL